MSIFRHECVVVLVVVVLLLLRPCRLPRRRRIWKPAPRGGVMTRDKRRAVNVKSMQSRDECRAENRDATRPSRGTKATLYGQIPRVRGVGERWCPRDNQGRGAVRQDTSRRE
ncbi:hypothetical protein E2C01_059971 [Portunus trituberculatus]|uniref:Secreted protein n=1 Tax=Portunus trituberculatus TaxID=210409 RepID=A0A5B7H822_PORTR|nr:hypothetical protein [Portunus trituberculatus]